MTTTDVPAATVPTSRRERMALAHTAYDRLADLVQTIGHDDWNRPTDCEGWTVRHLVGHLAGAMRSAASLREMISQQREIGARVRHEGGNEVDTMTQVQIDRTSGLDNAALVAEIRALVGPATTGRRRTPAPLRKVVRFPVEIGSISERWSLGYLVDVILTRDAWLHRIDLCRALDRDPLLTADHDGRIVADVVAEWARRHGQPFHLTLTGPAGGTFSSGPEDAAPESTHLTVDAVEFCRIVSGRASGEGLLATEVPF